MEYAEMFFLEKIKIVDLDFKKLYDKITRYKDKRKKTLSQTN
jgi:hypothetical protein